MLINGRPSRRRSIARMITRLVALFTLLALLLFWMTSMPARQRLPQYHFSAAEMETLRHNLEKHVTFLAGDLGERHLGRYEKLIGAAQYIEENWRGHEFLVVRQEFAVHGNKVWNIEITIKGENRPDEIVVVGAHYDSVPGSPGANDNASGVAMLLELARFLRDHHLPRTVSFVGFVNEEPPYFKTAAMGSRVYAERARKRQTQVKAMISLETVGYFTYSPGSQHYPLPFGGFYPDRGNFLAFVSNIASQKILRQAIAAFRKESSFPSEGLAAPVFVTGIDWSDQWSFWREGYPAIMITDTAPFRYPYYHTGKDTPDKLDYESMAAIIPGLAAVIVALAS